MHAEPIHDNARDPILDGRNSLRLVKVRLALTLVTVALLPIAAFTPLVREVADETSLAHHLRLGDDAGATAAKLGAEIGAIRASLAAMISDPVIVEASREVAGKRASTAASTRLADLLRRPTGAVDGISLVVGGAVRAASGRALDMRRLPEDRSPGIIPGTGSWAGTVLLVEAAPRTKRVPARSIVATIELEPLLGWAIPADSLPGTRVAILDSDGARVAEFSPPFDAAVLPSQFLDLATDAANGSDGYSSVLDDGLTGWSVVTSAPIPLAALPLNAIAALSGLFVLLTAFTVWMARQILRPAAQLEASRSRLRELYETAREAALRDSLTGLGNHRSFQEAVTRMVEAAQRYGSGFALVLFDVDEFKRINDTHGHAVGDQLLAQLGQLIRSTIRLSDAGYRVGGDEFAVLLPHTDAGGASIMTRRLLARALEDREVGVYRGPISFSAGVTSCPDYGTTRLELTAQADAALYRGKRDGRTVVTIYDPAIDHGHVDEGMRAELSSIISLVIESGMLTPVYQPIVDLATGVIAGYEGLVRVPRESTFPHAGALFDAAEISGRVVELDRAALDTVLAGARDLDSALSLSLNVSPLTLESEEFNATVLLAILQRHGMPPERVIVELTERQAARDPVRLASVIGDLQRAGVRVAADDVGAGNAGLRLLSQYRFDIVKIDLSLVHGAGGDQGLSVLTSLVQMAGRLGAVTIAEGVETAEQLLTIRRLGVTAGQGYLLGRPRPEHQVGWIDLIALESPSDSVEARIPVAVRRAVPAALGGEPWPGLMADADQLGEGPFGIRSPSMAVLNTSSVSNE